MFKKNHLRITTYDQNHVIDLSHNHLRITTCDRDHIINLAHISHVKYFSYNPNAPENEGGKDERVEIVMMGVPDIIIIKSKRQRAIINFYKNLINKLKYSEI